MSTVLSYPFHLGMAISTQPVGTQLGMTLMGRVWVFFFFLKKLEVGPGQVQVLVKTRLEPKHDLTRLA